MPSIRERQDAWSTLSRIADEANDAVTRAEQKIAEITKSDVYAQDYKTQLIQQERQKLEATGRELLARAQAARETLLAGARELEAPAGDAAAQLLAETRAQRAWARVKPQLDAGVHWSQVLDQAVAARDGSTVLALRDELPAYLTVAAGKDAEVDLGQLRRALDIATFRALGDDKGAGSAARMRLHAEVRYPVAELVIQQAVSGRGLDRSISLVYAQREAADVEAKLGETPQEAPPAVTREAQAKARQREVDLPALD